jgi:2-octaprenyl-6-methoxyphenol hydroxylase
MSARPHASARPSEAAAPTTEAGLPIDVLIAGGGMVGLTLAVALRGALGAAITIEVCDPAIHVDGSPTRASALAAGPRRMFERLGVWDAMADRAQLIRRMEITDSRLHDAVRPQYLQFDAESEPGEPVAHMIHNADLVAALRARAQALDVRLTSAGVRDARPGASLSRVAVDDGTSRDARLVVAADGAKSRLRALAGIETIGWDYGQAGIVATIGHERDHDGVARQHFLPAGPFAILPLKGRRSSIVWNERVEDARELCRLDPADFLAELTPRFGRELGALTLIDKPIWFPFSLRLARAFVAPRLALVGDAAHLVHPIAGQGVNLGLRDAAALAEEIVEAIRLGLDPGGSEPLAAYQSARRSDTMTMVAGMDALNRLFSNDLPPLRFLRDLGLGLVDRAPALKRLFIARATGVGAGPRLLRGEGL